MAEKQIFEVLLEKHGNSEATGITIPFDVEKVFGAKRVSPIRKTEIRVSKFNRVFTQNFKPRKFDFSALD